MRVITLRPHRRAAPEDRPMRGVWTMPEHEAPLLFLSQLGRASVVGPDGNHLARLDDVIARLADDGYPRITGFVILIGGRHLFVPTEQVTVLAPGRLELREQKLDFGQFERRP